MDIRTLVALGLTASQAKTYLELVKAGSLTPPQLAKLTGESRTSAYMALSRLEEFGLAGLKDDAKKATYTAANPSALEKVVAKRRQDLLATEDLLRSSLPKLMTYYYTNRGEPGIKFYQGKDGLVKIYEDHLKTKKDVYFVRTVADEEYFGDVLYEYMQKRAKLGIKAHGLAPDRQLDRQYAQKNDKQLNREMSWYDPKSYTSPVEISVYGDKVSLISFGKEAVGTIIESPQIAQAFRDLFNMAKKGATSK